MSERIALPSNEALAKQAAAVRATVEAFARERPDDDIAWTQLPGLAWKPVQQTKRHSAVAEPSSGELRRLRRQIRAEPGPAPDEGLVTGGGVLFLAPAQNMRRSQAPLLRQFGPVVPAGAGEREGADSVKLVRSALDSGRAMLARASRDGTALPIEAERLLRRFAQAARAMSWLRGVIAAERPSLVVVGSVGAPRARALILAARDAGVPSLYVPHSPLLTDAGRNGIPTDVAALRGEGEVDHLRSCGARGDGLEVVGVPSIDAVAPPEQQLAEVVFAPSPDPRGVLKPLVRVIEAAEPSAVLVCPHPASRRRMLRRICPDGWPLWEGRTYDALRRGPTAVIQHSSGVALESLSLGLPTIELHQPGVDPIYPLIKAPAVDMVSDSQALAAALERARATIADPARRETLIDWARRWSNPRGEAAAARLVELAEAAMSADGQGPAWDSWGELARR